MDIELEHQLKVVKSEYDSLYSWGILEVDDKGEQANKYQTPLIPWRYGLMFLAKNLTYSPTFELDRINERLGNDDDYNFKDIKEYENRERISGLLSPSKKRPTVYSMFGTKRLIENFFLNIELSEEEYSHIWGCPQYSYELDFRNGISEDILLKTHMC